MSSRLPLSPTRFVLIIVALFIGGVALVTAFSHSRSAEAAEGPLPTVHTKASLSTIPFQSPDQSSIRQINLHAKDLVVDPNTQKIYASVPSVAGSSGNSIASFDPATGLIGPSIFIGSEPAKMAISNNGQFIYVALNGAAAVRRFDVATQTAGPQISLGNDSFSGPFFPRDMAVQPGNAATLAVLRSTSNGAGTSVAIYDDVVQRSTVLNSSEFAVTFKATDPSRLYGLGGGTLRRMTVSPAGVASESTSSVPANGAIQFDDGRLYTSSGHVLDPEAGSLFGTFSGTNINGSTPFVSDSVVRRVYFLTAPFSSPGSPTTLTLRVFDQQTFVPLGTLDIPNVLGSPTRLVRWGSNGLAFCTTSGEFFVIQTTLIPSPDPVPTPTPTPSSTPTPVPPPPIEQAFVRQIPLLASDIIYDPGTQRIYASVTSRAGATGNSITPISTANGTTGASVFVGSEPNKLALSDNGQYLYVSLDGAAAVRRVDIASQTAGLKFSLGTGAFSAGPLLVEDMEVVPGDATAVAISRKNVGFSPRHEGVAIYDNGVQRSTTTPNHTGSNVIEFSATADTLYGLNNETTEFGFRKMSVTTLGVTVTSVTGGIGSSFGNGIEFNGGRVYFQTGRILDPESVSLVGTFPDISFGNLVQPDSSVGRVFFIDGAGLPDDAMGSTVRIRAFDLNTFLPLGSVTVSGVNGRVRSFIRWGTNGLAFCTSGGQVYLIQSSLVSSTDPAPTPTPTPAVTPTPTPTPVPTPAAGELRQISLATNDLVVDPNSQTIFASIPSSAGATGNSLAPIDATAGTVGQTVFVGSEPNKLAISDNGESIYVGLDGANAVRRFNVPSRTPGIQFSLGSDPFFGAYRAEDMAVAPGQPAVLAVSRLRPSVSPRHGGVAVFDNGVQRTLTTPDHTGSNVIEFSTSPFVLYGQNTETTEFGFRRMAVASCGVVTLKTTQNLLSGFGGEFKADNGVAYSAGGRAIDPEATVILGTFVLRAPNSFSFSPSLVAPDSRAGRVYFLIEENGVLFLRVFDNDTFLKVGELRLPGVTGTLASLVRWGTNGLAFRNTSGQVFLLQNSLIGGIDPSFTPAPVPPPPTATATVRVSSFNGDPGGVTVDVTGSTTTTGITDSGGNLAITGLPPCGSFTVTPSKPNYVFSPTNVVITNLSNNTNLNFTAILRTVGFQQNTFAVSESTAKLTVFVTRSVVTDPVTVTYETVSGTASDRSDFNTTLGTLQFASGETSKPITILLTNDTLVEGPEAFTLTLRDPIGADLTPGFSTATITINDDDTQPGAANPLADARFFVRQQYQDFLNRAAADDVSGFDFWTNQITSCDAEPDPQRKAECLALRRINVSAAFFISIEFQQTGYLVHRFYAASYPPNAARPRGLPRFSEFLRDTQELGRGVVVGAPGWEQKLEQNKQAFALAWINRPEFLAEHPQGQTGDQFVDSLFQNTGVTPTPAERAAAITAFGNGMADGRALALRSVAESASVYNQHFNSAFVLAQYFGYLRRNPDDAPDGNFNGYQFWLDKLNQFNGNFVQAEMVKAFLVSQEYQQRFGPANFDISR